MLKVKVLFSLWSAVVLLISSFQPVLAQTHHVIPTAGLHQELVKRSLDRQSSVESLERLFSRPEVAPTVEKTLGQTAIREAVAVLSDEELAQLAEKARGIEQDFAAGALSNQELTYIVIALATAVLILIIIAAGD